MGNTMSKEQALQLIKNVCAAFQGNLDAHRNIQTALSVLEKELEITKCEEKDKLQEAK